MPTVLATSGVQWRRSFGSAPALAVAVAVTQSTGSSSQAPLASSLFRTRARVRARAPVSSSGAEIFEAIDRPCVHRERHRIIAG
jgi:hypothetical protein